MNVSDETDAVREAEEWAQAEHEAEPLAADQVAPWAAQVLALTSWDVTAPVFHLGPPPGGELSGWVAPDGVIWLDPRVLSRWLVLHDGRDRGSAATGEPDHQLTQPRTANGPAPVGAGPFERVRQSSQGISVRPVLTGGKCLLMV